MESGLWFLVTCLYNLNSFATAIKYFNFTTPCQNLHQLTHGAAYVRRFTCVCSSSILDATVKGAEPRGPRLLTSVDTAASLGTSGPVRENIGHIHTELSGSALYIISKIPYVKRKETHYKNSNSFIVFSVSTALYLLSMLFPYNSQHYFYSRFSKPMLCWYVYE